MMSIRDVGVCVGCGAAKEPSLPGCGNCTRAMPENIPGAPSWRVARYRAVALGARSTVARVDQAVHDLLTTQAVT